MPRLMVTDSYHDRLITYHDFEDPINTELVEKFVRETLHHRGEIRDKGMRDGCHEWWVCGADRKPVYIVFQGRTSATSQ